MNNWRRLLTQEKNMARIWFLWSVILWTIFIPEICMAQLSGQKDAQSLLSAFMSYTDLRMRSVQQSLEILTSTAEVKSGKWENMKRLLEIYQKSDDKLALWYVLPDGRYYTVDRGLMDVRLSDRSYFADLMAGNRIIGSLVVSKSTGQRSAVTAIPIKEGDKVIAAIGASIFLDRLSEEIGSVLSLRPDAAFFALAPNGQTTLHQKTDRHFLDPRELGSETLKRTANEMLANEAGESSYFFDNVNKKAIYRTSHLLQWKFAITINVAPQK
jgi:hypothetical protein